MCLAVHYSTSWTHAINTATIAINTITIIIILNGEMCCSVICIYDVQTIKFNHWWYEWALIIFLMICKSSINVTFWNWIWNQLFDLFISIFLFFCFFKNMAMIHQQFSRIDERPSNNTPVMYIHAGCICVRLMWPGVFIGASYYLIWSIVRAIT